MARNQLKVNFFEHVARYARSDEALDRNAIEYSTGIKTVHAYRNPETVDQHPSENLGGTYKWLHHQAPKRMSIMHPRIIIDIRLQGYWPNWNVYPCLWTLDINCVLDEKDGWWTFRSYLERLFLQNHRSWTFFDNLN